MSYVPRRRRSLSAVCHGINSAADSLVQHIKLAVQPQLQFSFSARTLFIACQQCFILVALTSPVATLMLQAALGHMMDSSMMV